MEYNIIWINERTKTYILGVCGTVFENGRVKSGCLLLEEWLERHKGENIFISTGNQDCEEMINILTEEGYKKG